MSEKGPSQPNWAVRATSDLHPLVATAERTSQDVSNVPKTEVAISFERRVGTREQRQWDFDTQPFGSLEVDD